MSGSQSSPTPSNESPSQRATIRADGGAAVATPSDADLPDGWIVGIHTDTHFALVREGDTRKSISAHQMPAYTGKSGWFALARPGTGQVVAEGDPLETVIEQMIDAAAQYNETGEYPTVLSGSLRDEYDSGSRGGADTDDSAEIEGKQTETDQTDENGPSQTGIDDWL